MTRTVISTQAPPIPLRWEQGVLMWLPVLPPPPPSLPASPNVTAMTGQQRLAYEAHMRLVGWAARAPPRPPVGVYRPFRTYPPPPP